MNLEFLTSYSVALVIGICLCVGYIIKKWLKDVDNKFIPTILAIVGVCLNIWINGGTIDPGIVLAGLFSGLSSTGFHQVFKGLIERDNNS